MSASVASITDVTVSLPPRADHREFSLGPIARTPRQMGPSMIANENASVHAGAGRDERASGRRGRGGGAAGDQAHDAVISDEEARH